MSDQRNKDCLMGSMLRPIAALLPAVMALLLLALPRSALAQPAALPLASPGAIPAALLPHDLSVMGMFHNADVVVKAVMLGLIFASVLTWTVLLAKGVEILGATRQVRAALGAAEAAPSLPALVRSVGQGSGTRFAKAAALELRLSQGATPGGTKDRVASRLHRIEAALARRMTRGTGVLATIGSTAPFVGLFGTVWGIMNSFIGISQAQSTSLAVVAPGIAEALLATATGLVAAIPAVVIYNLFSRAVGGYRAVLGDLSAAVLRIAGRDVDMAWDRAASALPQAAE